MNYNNFSQKTNYIAGSAALNLTPFYLSTVNIPGITFNHPEIGSRPGARLTLQGDTVTYNSLSFEMLIDEDFKIYHEFMDRIVDAVNPETGSFANREFDFWIQIDNNKGTKLFKIEFYNCRIESIGDIQLDSQDETTEHTMSAELKYDYFKIIKSEDIPTIRP